MMDVHRERRVTWFVLGLIFLGLILVAVTAFNSNKKDQEAIDKANQLMAELKAAGMLVPQPQQIYEVLGDDGGAVCADPGDALEESGHELGCEQVGERRRVEVHRVFAEVVSGARLRRGRDRRPVDRSHR